MISPTEFAESMRANGYVMGERGWVKPSRFINENNIPNRHTRETPKLEPDPSNGTLGAVQVQERTGSKFLVRVTSFRKRLLDIDNLCEKYHVDCLRYAGLIPGDNPDQAQIEVQQGKTAKGQTEFTRIEVIELP